jgi:hypothetical protein
MIMYCTEMHEFGVVVHITVGSLSVNNTPYIGR